MGKRERAGEENGEGQEISEEFDTPTLYPYIQLPVGALYPQLCAFPHTLVAEASCPFCCVIRQICTGTTGHAEVVQITYDPSVLSYKEILEIFFTIHDPTTKDR